MKIGFRSKLNDYYNYFLDTTTSCFLLKYWNIYKKI